jgi:hypothetical protein
MPFLARPLRLALICLAVVACVLSACARPAPVADAPAASMRPAGALGPDLPEAFPDNLFSR